MRMASRHVASYAGALRVGALRGLLAGVAGLLMATSAQAQSGGWPANGDGPQYRPFIIEPAPGERAIDRDLRRPPAARTAPRDDRNDEGVPTPVPVARPAPSAGGSRTAAAAPGGTGCNNPNALGVSRDVEIDATGGPRYGFQQYKVIDFLREGEIVLTFDDGPMPAYTKPILQALSHHCTKATFFIVGRNALAYPEVVKDQAARGHTIANHTWSHANLGMRRIVPKRNPLADGGGAEQSAAAPAGSGLFTSSVPRAAHPAFTPGSIPQQPVFAPAMTPDKAKAEIELGFSATARALGVPMAPFFRFPYLGYSTAMHNYLSERHVAVFSIDVDSLDYRAKRADEVISKVMSDLAYQKKGILLFHDIQPATAQAMPALLDLLKAKGYKVVHIRPKSSLQTIASYDARVGKDGSKLDAVAEQKPLAKRTITWGMAPGSAAGVAPGGAAFAQTAESDAARRAKRPITKADRSEIPGYVPARAGQPEVLPWLTEPRRGNGW
jgi:peptidoglycan/xylan/chitin deacetylase (PgdA/CDA1 family)